MTTAPAPDRRTQAIESHGTGFLATLPVKLVPHRNLLVYYVLSSLLLGPAFLFILIPRYFRYITLRYDIDSEGIRMRWGILFRREVSLTYARIQDIHLASNVVERWLGLGRIQLQTASGNAAAEMTIEGVREFEELRDFLYDRMRGARAPSGADTAVRAVLLQTGSSELLAALAATAAEMRAIRELIAERLGPGGEGR
jgi:membrane protein YdbS with pleckstrin-like domain